ncbi:MAG: GAF domain-containing protein [Candidatus Zixiibacteriota bacterium]
MVQAVDRVMKPIPIEHIELFSDIARILREKSPSKRTVLEVMEIISKVVEFESATLYLMNNRQDKLDEIATRGETVNLISFLEFDQGTGLAAWAAKQKRPLHIPGREAGVAGVRENHDSVLLLPLLVAGELVGVLCFGDARPHAFDDNTQRYLEVVSHQFALSLERIILNRDLEAAKDKLAKSELKARTFEQEASTSDQFMEIARLAAEINSEINEPLAAIVGSAKIIELEAAHLPHGVGERVKAIVDGARQISLITHKLHKIDRIVTAQFGGDE